MPRGTQSLVQRTASLSPNSGQSTTQARPNPITPESLIQQLRDAHKSTRGGHRDTDSVNHQYKATIQEWYPERKQAVVRVTQDHGAKAYALVNLPVDRWKQINPQQCLEPQSRDELVVTNFARSPKDGRSGYVTKGYRFQQWGKSSGGIEEATEKTYVTYDAKAVAVNTQYVMLCSPGLGKTYALVSRFNEANLVPCPDVWYTLNSILYRSTPQQEQAIMRSHEVKLIAAEILYSTEYPRLFPDPVSVDAKGEHWIDTTLQNSNSGRFSTVVQLVAQVRHSAEYVAKTSLASDTVHGIRATFIAAGLPKLVADFKYQEGGYLPRAGDRYPIVFVAKRGFLSSENADTLRVEIQGARTFARIPRRREISRRHKSEAYYAKVTRQTQS